MLLLLLFDCLLLLMVYLLVISCFDCFIYANILEFLFYLSLCVCLLVFLRGCDCCCVDVMLLLTELLWCFFYIIILDDVDTIPIDLLGSMFYFLSILISIWFFNRVGYFLNMNTNNNKSIYKFKLFKSQRLFILYQLINFNNLNNDLTNEVIIYKITLSFHSFIH